MEVNILTGPPEDSSRDQEWLESFLSLPGKKIAAGGTTAALLSRFTGEEVLVYLETRRPGTPPWGTMPGIDLVTEGIVTLEAVVQGWSNRKGDGACGDRPPSAVEKMSALLEQAGKVTIFTGRGARRRELIERLSLLLEDERKTVIINLY